MGWARNRRETEKQSGKAWNQKAQLKLKLQNLEIWKNKKKLTGSFQNTAQRHATAWIFVLYDGTLFNRFEIVLRSSYYKIVP